MRPYCFIAAVALLPLPARAAPPTSQQASTCIAKSDADLVAKLWHGHAHPCSEFFRLDATEIVAISPAENLADVKVKLRYKVIQNTTADVAGRCTGVEITNPRAPFSKETVLEPKDRKISMQLWSTGWECK